MPSRTVRQLWVAEPSPDPGSGGGCCASTRTEQRGKAGAVDVSGGRGTGGVGRRRPGTKTFMQVGTMGPVQK